LELATLPAHGSRTYVAVLAIQVALYIGSGQTVTHGPIVQDLLINTNNSGASFFFIVGTHDSDWFSLWLHSLNQEVDWQPGSTFSSLELPKTAPVDLYIINQQVGSLIIMPP